MNQDKLNQQILADLKTIHKFCESFGVGCCYTSSFNSITDTWNISIIGNVFSDIRFDTVLHEVAKKIVNNTLNYKHSKMYVPGDTSDNEVEIR